MANSCNIAMVFPVTILPLKGWETELFGGTYDEAKPFERCKYGALNVTNDYRGAPATIDASVAAVFFTQRCRCYLCHAVR